MHLPSTITRPALGQKVAEQDRLDEVQGQVKSGALAPTQVSVGSGLAAREFLQRIGQPTASYTDKGAGTGNLAAVRAVDDESRTRGIDREKFQGDLTELALAEFSPAAQAVFVASLAKATPEGLSWAAAKVRGSLPPKNLDLRTVRGFFNDQGVKLFSRDKLSEALDQRYGLDQSAARAMLDGFEGGTLESKDVRRILGHLKGCHDNADVFWMQWQINRRVREGTLSLSGAAKTRLDSFFGERLDGAVNTKELSWVIEQAMRTTGPDGTSKPRFDEATVAEIRSLLAGAADNPKSMFHAKRLVAERIDEAKSAAGRPARKARRQAAFLRRKAEQEPSKSAALVSEAKALEAEATKLDAGLGAEEARLDAVGADFEAFLAPRVEGLIDRSALRKSTARAFRSGKIGLAETGAMMSAISMSRTEDEFAQASVLVVTMMVQAEILEEMMEAWDDFMEAMNRAFSDDEYDSNGNIVETGDARRLREREAQEVIQRMVADRDKVRELAERSFVRSSHRALKQVRPQAKTDEEAASFDNASAALEGEAADVDAASAIAG